MRNNAPNLAPFLLALLVAVPSFASADMGAVSTSYNATPPAFGSGGDTTVPAGVAMRSVFGSLTLSPTAISAANVTISICGGVVLENFNMPPISGNTQTWNYAFTVAGGDCYRFNNNLDPGAANKIASYNYVNVANESFESRAHANATWCPLSCGTDDDSAYETLAHAVASRAEMNATSAATAATECRLTDCANNTYLNSTVPPPTGFRIDSLTKETGSMVLKWDANTTTGPDVHTFVFVSGFSGAWDEGNLSVQLAFANTCDGFAEAWNQNMVTGAQSGRRHIDYNCDHQYSLKDKDAVNGFSATSNATMVHLAWDSDAAAQETTFEIDGNGSSTTLPPVWRSWDNWSFAPFYSPLDVQSRSYDAPLSDLSGGHTFLRMITKTDTGDESGANEGEGRSFTVSCEVDFVADGEPHACGTLAPATPTNVTTFVNQTFVNATAGGGIQFVPFVWGDEAIGAGQRAIVLGATGKDVAKSAAGLSFGMGGDVRTDTTTQPFGTTTASGPTFDGGSTMMLRAGTLVSLPVRAMGPYNGIADIVVASADAGATLAIQLQENGADVPGAVATWSAGDDAAKDIPLPNGSLPFLATDAFSLELTLTSADAANDAANLYNALMGIAWNGTGNATFVNQTVFVNASGESFLPILFGTNNDNAGMGDTRLYGDPPSLTQTGTQYSVFVGNYIVGPFPNAEAAGAGSSATGENDVFTMTRNGTFLSADVRAIGPYQGDNDCCPAEVGIPSTENVSLLVELQKNNVTLGSATWAPGEVATKTITLAGGAFVEGDNFRLVLTPSNTAPSNATYFNLVEATYGILWAGNASASAGPDDDSLYETIAHAAATYCLLSCAGGGGGGGATVATFSATALGLGAGTLMLALLGLALAGGAYFLVRSSRGGPPKGGTEK